LTLADLSAIVCETRTGVFLLKRITIIGLLCLLASAGAVVAGRAAAATAGEFTQRGVVTEIVDGDTLRVRLASGKSEKVRLIGIDAAERGACFAAPATERARQLALSKPVILRGDRTQDTRDRYGRLLAYVWIPGGRDLGYQLVAGGFAKVYVYRDPFQRLSAYRTAESRAKSAPAGAWKACGDTIRPVVPAPPPAGNCHPSYTPCLPVVGDLDCADVRALGVAPVRVTGSDPYRLDGDNDGYGCE
jgi:endonuclease YncB( thermonuclease family)